MSDYRRLISYIYEYEGDTKGKNVGFVKLEARSGQCRFHVNVKRVYVGGNSIGVYLLGKDSRKTLLGNMFVRNGIGEFRTIVDAANVEGTGDGMEQYYGLTIHDVNNSWRCYRTIWEDVEIVKAAEVQENESVRTYDNQKGVEPVNAINPVEVMDAVSGTQPDQGTAETEQLQGNSAAVQTQTTNKDDEVVEMNPEVASPHAGPATEPAQTSDETPNEDEAFHTPSIPSAVVSPELENPEVLQYLQETEQKPDSPEDLWQKLRKQYPKIQPFDYDGESEVLTIRPDDIGHLPRENWIYGNNSFLMHGYYNFRYIILVRLSQPGKRPRYLIGVPGHYYSNEKYMANMFGFPNFVLSKKQPSNDDRFGYWYTDVKMGG